MRTWRHSGAGADVTHILHITIDTGHAYRSERGDVSAEAMEAARILLRAALYRPAIPAATERMLIERSAEVGPIAVAALNAALSALHTRDMRHPRIFRGWNMSCGSEGRALLGTIFGNAATMDSAPVLSFGVAPTSRSGPKLWRSLVKSSIGRSASVGDPRHPPAVPWLATRMEIGAALAPPHVFALLADLQRCVAWAWIESEP